MSIKTEYKGVFYETKEQAKDAMSKDKRKAKNKAKKDKAQIKGINPRVENFPTAEKNEFLSVLRNVFNIGAVLVKDYHKIKYGHRIISIIGEFKDKEERSFLILEKRNEENEMILQMI